MKLRCYKLSNKSLQKISTLLKTSLAYPGNLGFVEMMKFYQIAADSEIAHMEQLIDDGKVDEAWTFLKEITGVDLEPLQ